MVSTVASWQKCPGFESSCTCLTCRVSWVRNPAMVGPFCVEFACSPRICVASSHCPKTCRLIGESKLPAGVNVSLNGCLFFLCQPCDEVEICPG